MHPSLTIAFRLVRQFRKRKQDKVSRSVRPISVISGIDHQGFAKLIDKYWFIQAVICLGPYNARTECWKVLRSQIKLTSAAREFFYLIQ